MENIPIAPWLKLQNWPDLAPHPPSFGYLNKVPAKHPLSIKKKANSKMHRNK